MIGELAERIAQVLPDWVVSYDESNMLNVAADSLTKAKCVYIEEYRNGNYNNAKYGNNRDDNYELYFFTTDNGQTFTATERDALRNMLESEGIVPILRDLGNRVVSAKYNIGVPKYDIFEVGITLRLTIREDIC